jgi:hypothetical protein
MAGKPKLCERYEENTCPIIATGYWLGLLKRQHIQQVITPEATYGKPDWTETEKAFDKMCQGLLDNIA